MDVQQDVGHSLMVVQAGLTPSNAKPLKGIGSGVFEIVTRHVGDTYRTVYAVQIAAPGVRAACVPKEIQERPGHAQTGCGLDQKPLPTSAGKGEAPMSKRKAIDYEEGSGNVFADLGLKNAEELFARAKIGLEVLKILQKRDLLQREIGTLLNIRQSEVSHLMRGHFHRFSEGKLLGFLKDSTAK